MRKSPSEFTFTVIELHTCSVQLASYSMRYATVSRNPMEQWYLLVLLLNLAHLTISLSHLSIYAVLHTFQSNHWVLMIG